MTRRLLFPFLCLLPFTFCLFFPDIVAAQPAPPRPALRVVSAGPTGEIRAGEEANEIRVVFSEPMVALAQVPPRLKPAYFHITPAVAGTFRWSGTTILILTPAKRLPLATKYDVTIDAGAAAVSGRKLAAPYTFSFMTPTASLLQTNWYRPGGRFDAAPIIVLRFNQPVKPDDVLAHLRAAFEKHPLHAAGDLRGRRRAAARDRSVGAAGVHREGRSARAPPPKRPTR